MKSKGFEILIGILIALLLVMIPVGVLLQVEDVKTTRLCVDGRGNENLDGKMCSIEYASLFGLDNFNSALLIFMLMFMTFLFLFLFISIILICNNNCLSPLFRVLIQNKWFDREGENLFPFLISNNNKKQTLKNYSKLNSRRKNKWNIKK